MVLIFIYWHVASYRTRSWATIMAIAQGTVIIPVLFVLNSLFGLTGVIWSLLIVKQFVPFSYVYCVFIKKSINS